MTKGADAMHAKTWQDYEREGGDVAGFVLAAIQAHKASGAYKTALEADLYDRQMNVTVNGYARILYSLTTEADAQGIERARVTRKDDFTASRSHLASNFFHRLNTQRVQYSLGAGVSFTNDAEGAAKAAMGEGFDHNMAEAAFYACIHGESFVFWNLDRTHVFKLTEFAPLYDERTGRLRGGIRFWRLAKDKPMEAVFYTEDGYTEWREDGKGELSPISADGAGADAAAVRPYVTVTSYLPADDSTTVIGERGYGSLPIVPVWAGRLKQSSLIGMRGQIDAYDLVKSGFANDLQDCAQVYWIIKNAGGMTDADYSRFRDRLLLEHIAGVDGVDGSEAVPYTQEIPYQARQALLKELRDGIYEDFGALDVHTVAAGATNDHIDAAYQPMDEEASDFEYWVGEAIRQLMRLAGAEGEPVFTRQRVSNQKEQVEMVATEAQWLDTRTILQMLPNIRPEQVTAIMEAMDGEDSARLGASGGEGE
jgi:hypothetical protein